MSKLPDAHKFIDLSDYGRPMAIIIANALKDTLVTPIHVTMWFVISGLIAIYCILFDHLFLAAFFLILKSILDAADGELARLKNTPSYTGRYLDSVSDIILNFLVLTAIWYTTELPFIFTLLAFIGVQLQGTLYNYYYVILRNNLNGDTTSRVFENDTPTALKGETQKNVDLLFLLYKIFYGVFDKTIYMLDANAYKSKIYPNIFMSMISIFGLGFQLLIISTMLVLGFKDYINVFFICFTLLILVFIGIRKLYL
ncbi:MAG: CDP-alcohol phosphatidyltransferase family protein [Flavobacteriaceae bacterium]|nr:CDP-alcohol phosphatidyltransferase family protein [Flavobacteriaceae bacterium]